MENVISKGNICRWSFYSLDMVVGFVKHLAPVHKRPFAHRTKKGPGRKHQQSRTLTKEQRNA